MMIRLRHGQMLDGCFCQKCDAWRKARVIFERFRVLYYYKPCGHLTVKGYTLPPEELERMRLVNQERTADPRIISRIQSLEEDKRREQVEFAKVSWIQNNLTRGKRFL